MARLRSSFARLARASRAVDAPRSASRPRFRRDFHDSRFARRAMTHSSHRTPQSTNQSIPRRAEWRLRRASHRDGASSRRRPGGALAEARKRTMDDEASSPWRVAYDAIARAREIVNECAATARDVRRVERGRARGRCARAVGGATQLSGRAVSDGRSRARGLIHARRRSVMKTTLIFEN